MPNIKYYAVKQGFKKGIFDNWDECKKSIEGYSGAEYKSFAFIDDAKNYLSDKDITEDLILNLAEDEVIAYVDGSFDENKKLYSFGCVIITPKREVIQHKDWGDEPEALKNRNIAGELKGVMYTIKWAYDNDYKLITIYHDYYGISKWFSGEWKAKSFVAKKYIDFISKYKNVLTINFKKVVGHAGNKYNELADKLAKEALF